MSSSQEAAEPEQIVSSTPAETAEPVDATPAPNNADGVADSAVAATAADSADAFPAPSEAKRQNALTALLKVLDCNDTDATAHTALRAVQKMCMRIPQLSSELTRAQRYRLYTLLLLEDGEEAGAALPPSWTAYSEKALETHMAVAQQAAPLFPASLHVTPEELAGLFYHLGAETAFYFNPEMIDVILCMTYVVAGSASTDKAVVLGALYRLLCALQRDFLVSTASRLYEPATTALLRLMLQFYDPALATHVDQQQVDIGTYVLEWTRRLLILQSDMPTALHVLDWVFVLGDPVMVPYVALAYLITHRQHLLSLHTKSDLTACLATMRLVLPSSKAEAVDPQLVDGRATALMPVWSGKSLLQNADLLYRATPLSTQRMLDFCLYPDVGTLNKTPEDLQQYYANTTCLPLERSDLAAAFAKRREGDELPAREYIVVDCRSQASYDYVRLPTAVLVGDVLSYQQEELAEAMGRLETCRGRPLALFGTGRPIVEEVNLLKVLALHLIHKKAFPFVCIVPGGFKTTIPLLRNHVIDAVMSPAAAASLDSTAKAAGGGGDWGQQASTTAHHLSAKLSEISSMLPHVEAAEVRQRAEELGSKAKESVTAAGTWGWGMMQRLREGLSETREQASTALASVTTKLNTTSAPAPAPAATAAESTAASTTTTTTTACPAAAAAAAPSQPVNASQQIFSLGDDGEEEDLDLITSIPTRPMRGTVVNVPPQEQQHVPVAVAVAAAAAPAVTEAEGASTPDRHAAAHAEAAEASPAPVPPPPPHSQPQPTAKPTVKPTAPVASSPTAAAAPRGGSASQIPANIDAEFDELFGDLNTSSPLPAARTSASPTKPAAAVTQDDLFGE